MSLKLNNPFVRSNPQKEITELYEQYRGKFIAYLMKYYSIDQDTCQEIYQDSFWILYQNIHSGKLARLDASLYTYLLGIGKNKALKHFEKQNKRKETDLSAVPELTAADETDEWKQKQEIARQVIVEMENPCKKVLQLYYWKKMSMLDIATEMNYQGEQSAKNRKYLCMQTLKKLLAEKFRKEGLF